MRVLAVVVVESLFPSTSSFGEDVDGSEPAVISLEGGMEVAVLSPEGRGSCCPPSSERLIL